MRTEADTDLKITIITPENVQDYMNILTSYEFFGINDGSLSCFTVSDGEGSEPSGIMSVQIFPEFIKLERIDIFPEYKDKGYAEALLDFIKQRPEDAFLPIRAFFEDTEDTGYVRSLLESNGFIKKDTGFSVISGYLKDFINDDLKEKVKIPNDVLKKYKLTRLDDMPEKILRSYILKSPHDELLQFPDKTMDLGRFSDGSPFCMHDDKIKSAVLIEETEDYSQFTWTCGDDRIAVLICLEVARIDFMNEYGPMYTVRCLCHDRSMEEAYNKLFSECRRSEIKMYESE